MNEILALFFVAFVIIPITVETHNCIHPAPENERAVCDWKSKTWTKKFDLKTRKYYYVLDETSDTDNFVEIQARKRYWKRKEKNEKNNLGENVPKREYIQEARNKEDIN